jgi:hypothetical protein
MSLTLTNAKSFQTNVNNTIWDNQPQASISFFWRYETTGSTLGSVIGSPSLLTRQAGNSFSFWMGGSSTPGAVNIAFQVMNAAGTTTTTTQTFAVGSVYHIAVTYAQGQQVVWIDGVPTTFGTLTGNTKSWGVPFIMGGTPAGSPVVHTISDVAAWNGYLLTATDVANLRDSIQTPSQIGGTATWRGEWTLSGPVGTAAQIGDSGLINSFDGTTCNFTSMSGTGTAIYAPALSFQPPVGVQSAYVATSGKMIGVVLQSVNGGAVVPATSVITPPTLYKNGNSVGQLSTSWITGYYNRCLFFVPSGVSFGPTDTATLSAPSGWINTSAGICGAVSNLPLTNYVGKSAIGTSSLTKTFKPGWNFPHLGTIVWSTYQIPKNWLYRIGGFSNVATQTPDGKPLTLTNANAYAEFSYNNSGNGLDNTFYPGTPGLYAIGWDDLNPSQPSTFSLLTLDTTNTVVTERTDLANPGSGGIGKVRVFNVQHASSAVNVNLDIWVQLTCSSLAPQFNNLVIYGSGDFNYQTNVPTVLNRSNPYALSATFMDRMKYGCGSMRFVDSDWNFGGLSSIADPEQLHNLTDFAWGQGIQPIKSTIGYTQARPWNPSVTGYVYTDLFGSPFTATLAANIDNHTTTLTISDAATAPVIYGLKLQVDSELMRVLSVSGTTVTVERGSCGTTATSHNAGSIQVLNRYPINWSNWGNGGQITELVTQNPHGIRTGQAPGWGGSWPEFFYTDGSHGFPGGFGGYNRTAFVTSANTYIVGFGGAINPNAQSVTMAQTYTLNPSNNTTIWNWPDNAGYPPEFSAIVVAQFPGCAYHVNVPHAASDSLAFVVAKRTFTYLPTDRTIYLEFTNEPWNNGFSESNVWTGTVSSWLYPGGFGREWYIVRANQIRNIFQEVASSMNWTGRIVLVLNNQFVNPPGAQSYLNFAQANNINVGGIAIAPYIVTDSSVTSQIAWWQADDDQAVDLFIHDLLFNVSANGYPAIMNATMGYIAAYNAATGNNCVLYGYEGGISSSVPVANTTLSTTIDNQTQTVPVASAAAYIVGQYIVVSETELMRITAINGNTLTVNRGQSGIQDVGSTAVAHNSGDSVRSCYKERNYDLIYNPNWYIAEQDWFGMLQTYGFVNLNQYAYSMAAVGNAQWGAYHWEGQLHGRGDGSDGLADNRLTLGCPGKPHTKTPNVNQDQANVSVRGQAFLDWMKSMVHNRRPRLVFPSRRKMRS